MASSLFADLARRVFENAHTLSRVECQKKLWPEIEASGLNRMLAPEEQGGAGDAFADAIEVMIAYGETGSSAPLIETMVANWLIASAGGDVTAGAKALLLPPDLTGSIVNNSAGVSWAADGLVFGAGFAGEGVTVTTTAAGDHYVFGLDISAISPQEESIDGEPLARAVLTCPLPITQNLSSKLDCNDACALAALLASAAMVGALERCCSLTIDYANTRQQFGRAISRFQAVQNMAARMASETAAARAAVEFAAAEFAGPNRLWASTIAKSRSSEAAGLVAADAHQIHGAIGYTREYELHHHTRKLWALRDRFGSDSYWNERIATAAIQAGGAGLWSGLVDGMVL